MNEVSIKPVLESIYNIMRESPMGVPSCTLQLLLSQRIGVLFNPKNFQCHSLAEFLKKYVMPTMEIEIFMTNQVDPD